MHDPKLPYGTKYCKCPSCGEYFTTVTNFDLHRAGPPENRRCIPPGKLVTEKGKARLRLNAKGYWSRTGGIYLGPNK
jgi:hypothetical protein